MHIGDMLHLVGDHKLSAFEWGAALVAVCNDKLAAHTSDDAHLLTVEMTSAEARAALYRLPATELAELITLDFDPGSHVVHVEGPVLEHPGPAPEPMEEPTAPVKTKSFTALIVGAVLVVVALLLAVAMATTATDQTGNNPALPSADSITELLSDVIHSYMEAEHPQNPQHQTP